MPRRAARLLTAAEIAAVIGVSASAVRHTVRRNSIKAIGKGDNGANLYDVHQVLEEAGWHFRGDTPERESPGDLA